MNNACAGLGQQHAAMQGPSKGPASLASSSQPDTLGPACPPARLPACLPACLPARPPARPPARLPACLPARLPACLQLPGWTRRALSGCSAATPTRRPGRQSGSAFRRRWKGAWLRLSRRRPGPWRRSGSSTGAERQRRRPRRRQQRRPPTGVGESHEWAGPAGRSAPCCAIICYISGLVQLSFETLSGAEHVSA